MLTVLAFVGDAVLGLWCVLKAVVDGVMGFAGYPEHDDDETRVPAWLGWLVWFIAVAGLLGTAILLAIQG